MDSIANTFATAQNEPTAAARDLVKKAAGAAKERVTTLHADADKATTAVEQKLVAAVGEVANLARQAQQAAYEDAQAFFAGVDRLVSAKSVGEAAQIYVDFLGGRSDVAMARARAIVGKFVAGAKTAQDAISHDGLFNKAA